MSFPVVDAVGGGGSLHGFVYGDSFDNAGIVSYTSMDGWLDWQARRELLEERKEPHEMHRVSNGKEWTY